MGTSTATLHLRGIELEALAAVLGGETVLRDNNPPWLDVLTPNASQASTLEKLAKKLTKGRPESAALLFDYFDDDLFYCALYREGKKAAGCRSGESWAKLGKALDALFGDKLAGQAFRYAARCVELEEQVLLLEETVGTALLDHPEFEPRVVPRSDALLREIKAREAALRKRKNQCVLTELPVEEWPRDWQAQFCLYSRIRKNWQGFSASNLLYFFGNSKGSVPQHPELAAHCYHDAAHRDHLLLCELDSGTVKEVRLPKGQPDRLLWRTVQGEPVLLLYDILKETHSGGWSRMAGNGFAACLNPDGSPRWRFVPSTEGETLTHVHTAPEGVITLFVRSHQTYDLHFGAQIWQIDGESGALLRKRALPVEERVLTLVRAEALGGFVYVANREELVVLSDELEEIARWPGRREFGLYEYLEEKHVVGPILWDPFGPPLLRCDLRTGAITETRPEVPVCVAAVLPDGRFLGVNEGRNRLTVFDPAGTVISRHTLEGTLTNVRCETDQVLILETRVRDTLGFIYGALFEEKPFHVWRLDPITP